MCVLVSISQIAAFLVFGYGTLSMQAFLALSGAFQFLKFLQNGGVLLAFKKVHT